MPPARDKPAHAAAPASQQDDTPEDACSLEEVLDLVEACARDAQEVSVEDVVRTVGSRTFAPLVLIPGLIMLAPGIGDIPGVPVLMGLVVILVMVQMLLHRRCLWLPGWLGRRSVRAERLQKTIGWLRKPSRFVDRWSRPRYEWAVRHGGFLVIAVASIAVAMATPLMEVVPFSANLAGIVITAYGLALISRDGLVALLADALAIVAGVVVVRGLL